MNDPQKQSTRSLCGILDHVTCLKPHPYERGRWGCSRQERSQRWSRSAWSTSPQPWRTSHPKAASRSPCLTHSKTNHFKSCMNGSNLFWNFGWRRIRCIKKQWDKPAKVVMCCQIFHGQWNRAILGGHPQIMYCSMGCWKRYAREFWKNWSMLHVMK